jgi:NitT/TauT family transport system substrate-binding protein
MKKGKFLVRGWFLAALALATVSASAQEIKLGTSNLMAYVAVPLMIDKGYFAAEGLKVELETFDSAQPITVALVAGDVDFGVGGLSAAFYNLAGQGKIRILAGGTREMPGFYNFAVAASNHAMAAGLKSLKDLPGHSVGVTQLGTSLEYTLGLIVEKYALDFSTIRVTALQSNTNLLAALVGNQLDAAVIPGGVAQPAITRGDVRRLAWLGDEVPGLMNNAAFASARMADEHPDIVKKFMRAYRKAARLYHDAVADADEHRRDGPHLDEIVASLAKFAHLSLDDTRTALPWVDGEARVDVADVRHQIAWYKSQGMIKGAVDADTLIDRRYALALPAR